MFLLSAWIIGYKGPCSLLSFLEITWPRQDWLFHHQRLAETQPGFRTAMQADIQPASYPTRSFWGVQSSNSQCCWQFPAEGRALLRVSLRQPHFHSPLPRLQWAPTRGCWAPPCPEQQKGCSQVRSSAMNHQGTFSVLEWLTVEIRAQFNVRAPCKRELSSSEGRQSTHSTQKAPPELCWGNLTSGERKNHPLPVPDLQFTRLFCLSSKI